MKSMCRDIVLSAQRVGLGLELEIERFKRFADEEKKRHAMGKSAWRLAVDLQDMIKFAELERAGLSDGDLLAKGAVHQKGVTDRVEVRHLLQVLGGGQEDGRCLPGHHEQMGTGVPAQDIGGWHQPPQGSGHGMREP